MTAGLGRRARSLEELAINSEAIGTFEPVNFRPLEPQPGDVFITCWAKSGTTLMQQMFHQLRSGGDMDFDDISRVVPWEDSGRVTDLDPNLPQPAAPRGFKSHREYERLPPGMRYVVTLRDPKETYVSFYRFINGWQLEDGAVSMTDFFPLWERGGPNGCDYATHLLSWYARRREADSLVATYRSVVANPAAMIRRLADFLDIALTPDLAALVEERTSRAFMHAHKDRFDDALVAAGFEKKIGIPADSDSSKVQAAGSRASQLPDAVAARIDAIWAERVAPVTGHADFDSLAAELEG